jgi:hypothetical protein
MGLEGNGVIPKGDSQRNTLVCRLYFGTLKVISSLYSAHMPSCTRRKEGEIKLLLKIYLSVKMVY